MRFFRRRARENAPATPAGAETLAKSLVRAELRARVALHARRAALCGAAVLVVLTGVSGYLATVGLKDCSERERVCRETQFYFLSTVTSSVVEVNQGTGEIDGWRSEWYRNGEPWIQGHYVMGEKDGVWREYWGHGDLRYEGEYRRGTKTGRETWWYANGNPEWTGAYNDDGLRDGSEVWWWESGGVRRIGVMHDGEKDGHFTLWHPDGTLAFTVEHAAEEG